MKIKGITEKEAKAITEYRELLFKEFPRRFKKLILFGSKARGTSNRFSDIDLLVVIKNNGKKVNREIAILTHEPILHFEVLLSPIVVEEKFFKEWSPLLAHVKKDGIVIWMNKKLGKNT